MLTGDPSIRGGDWSRGDAADGGLISLGERVRVEGGVVCGLGEGMGWG